jgi:sugar lactone lactonase YvrE
MPADPPRLQAQLVCDARAEVGEGPVWDVERQVLWWVDIAGTIHRFDPADGSDRTFPVGTTVGAVALTSAGDLVMALKDSFAVARVTEEGVAVPGSMIAPGEADDPTTRFNDGKVDPAGRFWAGTMDDEESRSVGRLYRLDPGGHVTVMLDGLTISNGLGWSLDGRAMYFIDSATRRVDVMAFDRDSGSIGDRRPIIDLTDGDVLPDGMTIDADGALWIALWGAGEVRRYLPDGGLDRVVHLPVTQVTSCAFGGPGLDDLYVTSARGDLTPAELEDQPLAGALFCCQPGVGGLPPDRFAG